MNLKVFILFFIFSWLVLLQFILSPTVINGNDLNGNIVPLLHFKESVIKHHKFPQWNPYIDQGIPAIADPLYGIYNPVISIPILIFDYSTAIKVTYFFSVLLACLSMFCLARLYKTSPTVSTLISMTYASGTYLASRVAAGHIEKVVSFGFLPLFLFCIVKISQDRKILWAGLAAITLSLILFTGDIYNCLYCLYGTAAIFLYYLLKDKKVSLLLMLTVIFFLSFSSIKIFPMIELQNYISKTKEPFNGGLNFFSIIYNLFFPFDLNIVSKNAISTGFGWWESLSFIGPFSILGLYFLAKSSLTKSSGKIPILIVLTILFLLLSTPDAPINPLYYIISSISTLQYFHVPSRILALWGIIILLSFGLLVDAWKRKIIAIVVLILNLVVVFAFSQKILATKEFGNINQETTAPLVWIANNNPNSYYTVHATSQGDIPQDQAYLHHLLMLQSNYGLILKGSLAEKYNFREEKSYVDLKPGFVISKTNIENAELEKIREFDKNIILYKDSGATPFAAIDKEPQRPVFSVNEITLSANSEGKKHLLLLESKYPGWNAFVDGKKQELLVGRFLEVETVPGNHVYKFIYSSTPFYYGLIVSISTFSFWILYLVKNRASLLKSFV